MFYYVDHQCPQCKEGYDSQALGVSSGLGQPLYRCPHCGSVFSSGRLEWADMTVGKKAWYLIVSLLYVLATGGLGGLCFAQGVYQIQHGPQEWRVPWGLPEQWWGIFGWASLIGVIQIVRVYRSLARTNLKDQYANEFTAGSGLVVPAVPSAYCPPKLLRNGLQVFFIFAALVPLIVGWFISHWTAPKPGGP